MGGARTGDEDVKEVEGGGYNREESTWGGAVMGRRNEGRCTARVENSGAPTVRANWTGLCLAIGGTKLHCYC